MTLRASPDQSGSKTVEAESSFRLTKWYLDCVGEGGEAFIAYIAKAHFAGITLRYASTLVNRSGEPSVIRSSLRATPSPRLVDTTLTWSGGSLGAVATFASKAPPIRRVILDGNDGRVDWCCHMPLAQAEISLAGEAAIVGRGYVEELTLTVPPWRLPIDSLRWGRFLSKETSLIWIDWRGPHEKQVVLLNHDELGPTTIDPLAVAPIPAVATGDGSCQLVLQGPRVLREGALGRTALSVLPAVETLLPARILFTDEKKWVAKGRLQWGSQTYEGWVIHEVVRWP